MPSYDAIKKAVFYSRENPTLLADILMEVNDLNPIMGTVTITGTLKFNQELTAVTTALLGNTGTLLYQWYRGGVAIATATSSTYTTVAADIGEVLTVKVSSDVEEGYKIGTASAIIAKADGAAAPNLTGAANSITGLSAAVLYEYKADAEETYTAVDAGATSITGLAGGDYQVRIAETATTLASLAATVTVTKAAGGTAPELTGGVGTITGLDTLIIYEYKAAADELYTPVEAGATTITDLTAGDYHVRIAETDMASASAHAVVTVT